MSTFRTAVEPVKDAPLPKGEKPFSTSHVEADIPYTSYEEKNDHPFIVDQYELGDFWNKDKAYTMEVMDIDGFLRDKISRKEIANSTKAIKDYFKDLELTVGIKSYDPTTTKIAKLLSYIKTMRN